MKKDYLITYDLFAPGKDYSALHAGIEALGPHRHSLQSVWFVQTELTAEEIRDNLLKYIDENDKLFVMEAGQWSAYRMEDLFTWLSF